MHPLNELSDAFSSLASNIVIDERLCESLIETIVAKTSLENSVSYPCCTDLTLFWIIDLEVDVVLKLISVIEKKLSELRDSCVAVVEELCNTLFPDDPSDTFICCFEKLFRRYCSLVVSFC